MKHCHCIWIQTDLCYVLSHFSLFPVSFYCRRHLKNILKSGGLSVLLRKINKINGILLTFICLPYCMSSLLLCGTHKCHCLGALVASGFKALTM